MPVTGQRPPPVAGRLIVPTRRRVLTRTSAFAVYEMAAALERAEASARVLSARARASHTGSGLGAAFAAVAEAAPEGLVPAAGAGGALLARHLDQASLAAAAAAADLSEDVREAVAAAAQEARRWAGGARALDPQGVARAVRREVAAVRGLAADTMSHAGSWELLRLGTYLPRAGWVAALLSACARLAATDGWGGGAPWAAAAAITGADGLMGEDIARVQAAQFLLLDGRYPFSVAFAMAEVEGAVFALSREGVVDEQALPIVRVAVAPLHRPEAGTAAVGAMIAFMDEMLDAIGAVAVAATPRLAPARPGATAGAPAETAAA